MTKTLVIVESPAKGEHIQKYLGSDYIVVASKGHIADLAKGGKNGIGVDIENNFKPHYVINDDKIALLDKLIGYVKVCDVVLLATDDDREGNSISWHLSERLKQATEGKTVKRVKFHEIKKDVVLKAIKNATELDQDFMNIVHSQEGRRILDRIVGFTASPFLQTCLAPKLSAGRVQSVVTRLIIDREKQIEQHVPEVFFTISVNLSSDKKIGFQTQYPNKITDDKISKDLHTRLSKDPYIVSEVLAKEEKKNPEPPMITSTLQRIMSKKYGFDAARTMKAAQSLYESGFCTYLRTDSVRASEESIESARDYLKANNLEVPKKPIEYKNSDDAQNAHECIRPCDLAIDPKTQTLIADPDEKLTYEIIWKYFVASQMMPAVYNTLRVSAHVKGDKDAEVKASGKALKSLGFLEILGITDDSKIEIPNLKKGDELYLFGTKPVKTEKKQTQPPPRFSEDKLIKELVNKNIGRPATYADLLSKITNRNYVEKKGNVYHATDLGKQVTDLLTKNFTFMDYDYTAKMELQLDLIERGKLNHIEMLKKFYEPFKKELDKAYTNSGKDLCDKCGSPMVVRTAKATGDKFMGCTGFSKGCKFTKKI